MSTFFFHKMSLDKLLVLFILLLYTSTKSGLHFLYALWNTMSSNRLQLSLTSVCNVVEEKMVLPPSVRFLI